VIRNIDRVMFRGIRPKHIYLVRDALCVFRAATHAGDASSFRGKTHRNGLPDTPPRSGHYRRLIFESHLPDIARDESAFCKRGSFAFL